MIIINDYEVGTWGRRESGLCYIATGLAPMAFAVFSFIAKHSEEGGQSADVELVG